MGTVAEMHEIPMICWEFAEFENSARNFKEGEAKYAWLIHAIF